MARPGEGRLGGTGRRPVRPTEGVVGTAAGDRTHAADSRRRGRPAAYRRPRGVDRLPRPVRFATTPEKTTASGSTSRGSWSRPSPPQRAVDWSQRAVPLVPIPGLARRPVQRVPLQLLQVAVRRADAPRRGRGAPQARPVRRRPVARRSSAAATCSSASARTARPISRCSVRSRTARSRARSTAGGSTSTPAAASRHRIAPSGCARRPRRTVGRRSRAVDRPAESASFAAQRHGTRRPTSPSSNKETSRCAAKHFEPLPPPNR